MIARAGLIVVGVSDCRISSAPDDVLVTYALGSCIAVAICDPVAGVGGMLHFMLPGSGKFRVRAEMNPYLFADTGIPLLIRGVLEAGARRTRLRTFAAGAASVLDGSAVFDIGRRNYQAMRSTLNEAGLIVNGESVGGAESRIAKLELSTGHFFVRCGSDSERLVGKL